MFRFVGEATLPRGALDATLDAAQCQYNANHNASVTTAINQTNGKDKSLVVKL